MEQLHGTEFGLVQEIASVPPVRLGWTVRPAEPRDAARISEIYNEGIEDGQATFETRPRVPADIAGKLDTPANHLIVAEWSNTILGWASITPYSTRECYSGIGEASVYISRGARHQGLGRLLLDALIAVGVERGYHKLIGRLLASNTASRQLVRGLGFREVGVHQKHGQLGGQWVDVVIVERLIPENMS
jgi:L-amino acid N-acyltransferase YncA